MSILFQKKTICNRIFFTLAIYKRHKITLQLARNDLSSRCKSSQNLNQELLLWDMWWGLMVIKCLLKRGRSRVLQRPSEDSLGLFLSGDSQSYWYSSHSFVTWDPKNPEKAFQHFNQQFSVLLSIHFSSFSLNAQYKVSIVLLCVFDSQNLPFLQSNL